MTRKQRLVVVGALLAIVGALTKGLTHLDAGEEWLGWALVAGAGIGSIVLGGRLKRLREQEEAAPHADPPS